MKTLKGTIRRFKGGAAGAVVRIDRGNDIQVNLLVEQQLANQLAEQYGVRDPRNRDVYDMEPIIGAKVEYDESEMGLIVGLRVLPN